MRAVILAGGKGERLHPYTTVLPKPLLPVGDTPILEVVIRQLKAHGIRDFTFCVGYLGSLLEAYFGDGKRWDVSIEYSYEQEPLGTAGPLRLLKLKERFLVMNGDLLTTISYSEMIKYHIENRALATIALYRKKLKIDLGVVEVSPEGDLQKYIEKPMIEHWVSMGIYVFEPQVLEWIARVQGKLDLPDLMGMLMREKQKVKAYQPECEWLDIGRFDDYQIASKIIQESPGKFLK